MSGILYHKSMLGDAESAISLCEKALDYINAVEDKNSITPSICFFIGLYNSSIAANYLVLKNYQKSEEYSKIAIEHHRQAHDLRGEARTLITLGETYYRAGRKVEAEKVLNEAFQKHIKVGQNTRRIERLLTELRLMNWPLSTGS